MKKAAEIIVKIERGLAAVCLVVATCITFVAAITRVFGYPINWSIDMALFLWAWCIFFSGDLALRSDKLVRVDMLVDRIPEKGRKIHRSH